jgi:hypothetical protein
MSNTYNLKITSLETRQVANVEGVVTVAHFEYIGTAASGAVAKVKGNCNLFFSEGSAFIPLAELTEATVIDWVTTYLGRGVFENYERILDNGLRNTGISVVTTSLPWAQE